MQTILASSVIPSNSYDVNYKVEKVATTTPAPDNLIATVLAYVFDDNGNVALTRHPERGWGLPGGHRESGESVIQAIFREVKEETCIEITKIKPIGFIKMEMIGPKPEGYQYPHPTRIGQVFSARVKNILPFIAIDDALERTFRSATELQDRDITLQYEDELLWLPHAIKSQKLG